MKHDNTPLEFKYVLGMDPGETTGIAMLRYTETMPPELIYLHQIEGGRRGFLEWFQGAAPGEDVTLVSEMWDEHNIKGANREPIYIEGVQYALWQDDIEYQTPDMKSLVPDEELVRNNLWTPGKRHQMDALIHALVWLRNNDHKPTLKALSDPEEEFEEEVEPIAEPGDADRLTLTQEEVDAMMGVTESDEGEAGEGESGEGAGEGEGEEDSKGDGGSDAEATSSGGAGGYDENWKDPELKGERKRRERNGVFAGFQPADSSETVLWED